MTNYKQLAQEYLKACHPDLDEPIMAFADYLDSQTPKIEKLEFKETNIATDIKVINKINEIISYLT